MANCIIRVTCGQCKRTFDIYWRDIKNPAANVCPYCGGAIDRELWENSVIAAAAAALDCNMELEKYATGYKKPCYSISFLQRKEI